MIDFLKKLKPLIQHRANQIQTAKIPPKNSIDFCSIFEHSSKPVIIAEIKFASPSRGKIYNGRLNSVQIAQSYLNNKASALSVLTEPDFFKGDINYISKIRANFPNAPILCKDFILSKKQILQALSYGANAVLLIVAFLEPLLLKVLYNYAMSLNLTPLIEIHSLSELEIALELNPKIIGVNNRNLNTLDIDLNTSRNLIKKIPKHIYTVCESGIASVFDIQEMSRLGFHGFLIGSHFMLHPNPGEVLGKFINGVNHAR